MIMAQDDVDLFIALRFLYYLSQFCGTIFFTISGPVGNRKISVTRKNIIACIVQLLSILPTFTYLTIHKMFVSRKFELVHVPHCILIINYLVLVYANFFAQIFKGNDILFIFKKLYITSASMRKYKATVDYKVLRKYTILNLLFQLFFVTCLFIKFFLQFNDILFICHLFADLMTVTVVTQCRVILAIICNFLKHIYIIALENIHLRPREFDILIKNLMLIHSDLYDICKKINSFFQFMIVRIFIIFTCLIYSIFRLVVDINTNKFQVLWLIDTMVWNCFNSVGIILTIFMYAYTKTEVRFIVFF